MAILIQAISVICLVCLSEATLINEEVSRVIDLKSHLVKVATAVTLKNDGDKPVSEFQFILDPLHVSQLAHIGITQGSEDDEDLVTLKMTEVSDAAAKIYKVKLPASLAPKASTKFNAEEVYFGAISPFPKEITQSQNQLIVYRGNHFYYSPYVTTVQTTSVELPSGTVESYTKFGNPEKEDAVIKYAGSEEFDNVPAGSQNQMKIHYENNNPFLTVTKMTRVIEVSHWGNIAVEETVDVAHKGAKLKGSFSRYDYQRQPNSGVSSVKKFKTILPASAEDVYYRDEIGNISTSHLYKSEESVDFEVTPRFPLFGGWKTHYYYGYNLPSYNYLYSRGDQNALKMRFIDHIMDDQLVEDFTLQVILPEGCKNIKVSLPYDAERLADKLHYTYLDTAGRPVITFTKSNLIEQHIEDFTLSYTFNRLLLLQEPMLIVAAFFILFFTVIIVVRLDFSIAHDSMLDTRMRVQGVMEQVKTHQARRAGCYKAYEAAISKYKASKDQAGLTSSRKTIDRDHKEASTVINTIMAKLREDAVEAADRVAQLNKADGELKEKWNAAAQLAERLVQKRLTRDAYADSDAKLQRQIDDLRAKIDELTDAL